MHMGEESSKKEEKIKANKLINEKSPYLKRLAYSRVYWYPWSREAFDAAKKEDKPVFISIGYNSCYWCHVMESENFDSDDVAELLNKHFICIKVDREELPEVDNFYMACAQVAARISGWPLNVFATPEKKPFHFEAYLPKENIHGKLGFRDLIIMIARAWKENRENIEKRADEVFEAGKKVLSGKISKDMAIKSEIDDEIIKSAYEQLILNFDYAYGGFFVAAPKFPTPHYILFLLRIWSHNRDNRAIEACKIILDRLRLGGIFDQLGYGFHRYTVDREWKLPHFEKMLYDQAMLLTAYSEAYLATREEKYRKTAWEIVEFVLRELRGEEKAFYSSISALSDGGEGNYYFWKAEDIDNALSREEAELAKKIFSISYEGNFEDPIEKRTVGKNVLYLQKELSELAKELGISEKRLAEKYESIREKLFKARKKRSQPEIDYKILADWNSLMIASLSTAYRIFGNEDYLKAAEEACDFIVKNMMKNNELYHSYAQGELKVKGYLDDYAIFIYALIELYQSTFDLKYLELAVNLCNRMIELFYDASEHGFFFTRKNEEEIAGQKISYDATYPCGNSFATYDLILLSRITGNFDYSEKAMQTFKAFGKEMNRIPYAHSFLINAYAFARNASEIIIAGKKSDENVRKALALINKEYLPYKVVVIIDENEREKISKLIPFAEKFKMMGNKATFYVCKNHSCKAPTNELKKLAEILRIGRQ